jgi:TldD protein
MTDIKAIEEAGGFVAARGRNEGASYADFRAVAITTEAVRLADGKPDLISRRVSFGYGIRALADGAWGFAAMPDLEKKAVEGALREAVQIARSSAKLAPLPVHLAAQSATAGNFKTPVQIDPFTLPLKEKVSFLQHLDELLRATQGINSTSTFLDFRREEKWFYSSEGSVITQTIVHSGGGFTAAAKRSRREVGERSFPTSGGQYASGGYEVITALGMEAACPEIAQQAVALLDAPSLPEKRTNLILAGDLVSLQIHESIGHPLELDRVFGSERNFSGTSFATPDKLGSLKYASDIVTVTADPTAPGGLGTFGFDDEGVTARPAALIDKGVLVNYLSSRETAARIKKDSTGAMRAESWSDLPLVRMTNTNLTPGKGTLDQLIAETDDGVLISTPDKWSIDDRRENFQLGGEIAWEIKNGRLGQVYKNAVYSGSTVEFWNSCDWICGPDEYRIWGTPTCGKGQPGQNMRTGQGAAPARFGNVKIGQTA